jgi:YfiH family protein
MFDIMTEPEKIIPPEPGAAFTWVRLPAGWGLVCRPLEPLARHVFTSKSWLLALALEADGWQQVAEAVGTDPARLLRVRQVHGANVLVHLPARSPAPAVPADIIVGDDASMALAIQTADCVPLLIGDRRTGAVAAAHAGWRGTALRVAAVAVNAMTTELGSRPSDLVAAIGPSIGPCCYQVGAEVREHFGHAGFDAGELARWFATDPSHLPANPPMVGLSGRLTPGGPFLDLWAATRDQLAEAGVPRDSIFAAELCTASHGGVFCSYRRDGKAAGRLAAAIRSLKSEV